MSKWWYVTKDKTGSSILLDHNAGQKSSDMFAGYEE
jgi:hypothetical protein